MTEQFETLEAAQLDHVTGGNMDIGGLIGQFAGVLGPALEQAGVKGAAQMTQQIAPIAQQIAGLAQGAGSQSG
jgi:hypothetical protein